MWRIYLILILGAAIAIVALVFGLKELLLSLIALPLLVLDKMFGALGADAQVAEPGRARRGSLGGGTTKSEEENGKRTRPRRSGF